MPLIPPKEAIAEAIKRLPLLIGQINWYLEDPGHRLAVLKTDIPDMKCLIALGQLLQEGKIGELATKGEIEKDIIASGVKVKLPYFEKDTELYDGTPDYFEGYIIQPDKLAPILVNKLPKPQEVMGREEVCEIIEPYLKKLLLWVCGKSPEREDGLDIDDCKEGIADALLRSGVGATV